jgi:kumamolisin
MMPGASVLAPADRDETLEVSLLVRRRAADRFRSRVAALASGARAAPHMTREEFAREHGAEANDLARVRDFAQAHNLKVVQEHAARRTTVLSGTVADFCAAFDIELQKVAYPGGTYRGRTGAIHLPIELDGIVEAVLGLDNRPQAKTHFRIQSTDRKHKHAAPSGAFEPPQVASLYGYPSGTGEGQCIGLIELGGGYTSQDLGTYFSGLKITAPKVTAIPVDNGSNAPTGNSSGPDGEVMLDIEVAGSIAPRASIAVYFSPNTDAGFLDAITTAIHDTTHKPSVISISWGGPESTWTSQAMNSMSEAFEAAATLGITVCVASGDNGSSDGVSDGADHVDFPASSPFALACGGTSLKSSKSSIASETVWDDGSSGGATGGGVSTVFPLPTWQKGLIALTTEGSSESLTMRGVPDVAGDADPETGYEVRVDGSSMVIGGTSAVAPLWAALIALINQSTGKSAGYINPLLYQNPQALRDVTQGNNGDFAAQAGWDACTGLGSPNGMTLASVLSGSTGSRR